MSADQLLFPDTDGKMRGVSDRDGLLAAVIASARRSDDGIPGLDDLSPDFPELDQATLDRLVELLERIGAIAGSPPLPAIDPRYRNNLHYYGLFDGAAPASIHDQMRQAAVLVLGAGGIGSAVLVNLLGLGVGRVVILDDDVVDRSNLNRQFLYDEHNVGSQKVIGAANRLQPLNTDTRIDSIRCRIRDGSELGALLCDVDLVVVAIDDPPHIRWVVNQACVAAGVPFVTGGIAGATGVYLAVSPGKGPCLECLMPNPERSEVGMDSGLANTSIGPMTTMLGGLMSLEALRLLTGVAPPVAVGRPWTVNGLTGAVQAEEPWTREVDCPVCGIAAVEPRSTT